MKKISFPLTLLLKSPAVGDLQTALKFLLAKAAILQSNPRMRLQRSKALKVDSTYGPTTAKVVAAFQEENRLQASGDVDEATANALNRLLKEFGALDVPPATPPEIPKPAWLVSGVVQDSSGRLLANLKVLVLDQNVRGSREIGSASTDDRGAFELPFDFPLGKENGEASSSQSPAAPDLLFQIADSSGRSREVIALRLSGLGGEMNVHRIAPADDAPFIIVNAGKQSRVTIEIDEVEGVDGLSEFEEVEALLKPVLQGLGYHELQEGNGQFQVSFLSAETGLRGEIVQRLVAAAQLARRTEETRAPVPTAALYGLAHAALPLDWVALARVGQSVITKALQQAIDEDVIPRRLGRDLEALVQAILSAAVGAALSENGAGNGTPAEWLSLSGLDDEIQQRLLRELADHDGPPEDLWKRLADDPTMGGAGPVRRAELTLRLASFTSQNLPLVRLLMEEHGTQSPADVALLDESDWLSLVERAGVPASNPGAEDGEKPEVYALRLRRVAQAHFPTAAVEGITTRLHVDLNLDADVSSWLGTVRHAAEKGEIPALDLRSTHLDRFFEEQGAHVFVPGRNVEQVRSDLKRIQRTLALTEEPAHIVTLLREKHDSAFKVAHLPLAEFVTAHASAVGEETARRIHAKAVQTHSAHFALHLSVLDAIRSAPMKMLGGADARELYHSIVKSVPSYADLFGETALCDCNHCESILSPSAYFVDLLQFLSRSAKNARGRTPLQVLLARRPDLEHILLTCENSDTPLPAIDLVNEALETMVALGKLDESAAHDTGQATAEELAANPQYAIAKARDDLRDAVYPVNLPFDMRLETARSYFSALGTSRGEIMATLRRDALAPVPDGPIRAALAAEALGLSELDFEVVSGTRFDGIDSSFTFADIYGLTGTMLKPILKAGDRSPAVMILQQKLNAGGANPALNPDGIFGRATMAALKAFQTAAGLAPNGATTPATWERLEGVGPSLGVGLLSQVTEFMRRTERSYVDVITLCQTKTFNPFGRAIASLSATSVTWPDIAELEGNGFTMPNPAIVAGAATLGFSTPDFVQWLKERYDGLASGIVIESTSDECDISAARLRRIDGSPLSEEVFTAINYFLRLANRVGLSIPELDCILSSLGLSDTRNAELLPSLAAILRLRARLKLSLAEIAVFFGRFETGASSLYSGLFFNRAALDLDPSFALALDERDLAVTAAPIAGHVSALIAAFRVNAEEFALIRSAAGLGDPSETMNLPKLARLYRYPLLARALGVSIAELSALLALSSPGVNLPSAFPDRPDGLERLVNDYDAVTAAGFSIAEVDHLLRHVAHPGLDETAVESRGALCATLHADQFDLAGEIAAGVGDSVERFRALLARLVGPESVDQLFGIVTGAASFTAPYSKSPAPGTTDALAPNVVFEQGQKALRFSRRAMPSPDDVTLGALTDGELATLKTAAGDDVELVQGLEILHARPRQVVADILAGLSDGTAVAVEIFRHDAEARDVNAKMAFLVSALTPYIHEALAGALIRQQLLSLFPIDPPLLALLIDDASLISAPATTLPLGMAFRALEHAGWSTEYFTSATLDGEPSFIGEIPLLSLTEQGTDSGAEAPIGSARWSATFLPRAAGSIVFEMRTNGSPVLWWNGTVVSSERTGDIWRFDSRTVEARERIDLVFEWRRVVAEPASVALTWISGTDARAPLPPRCVLPARIFRQAMNAMQRLDKAVRVLKVVKAEPALLRHAAAYPVAFSGFSLDALPLDRVESTATAIDDHARRLFRGLLLISSLAAVGRALRGEDALIKSLGAPSVDQAILAMSEALAWSEADIALLLGPAGFNADLAAVTGGRVLPLVRNAIILIRRVGISAADLLDFAANPVGAAQAETIKRAVRAKFDDVEWLTLSEGLNDPLRERWRDALASYLQVRLKLANRNQLFELLLLDTEVSSCVQTSRIRHGITAVQTFVQRVQLNLENFGPWSPYTVQPSTIDQRIWEAKKQYRVQEAARKVMLWPERYMKELQRDDRTPLFDRFIGDLGQAAMTPEGVESAFLNYLKGLDEIARLEICGAYAQDYDFGSREPVNLLHMIGRTTLGAPYTFHYRRLEDDAHWTPWERVPIDLDTIHDGACEGAHVLPVVWNRRLYVFWPIMEEKAVGKIPAGNAMNETEAHREWRRDHDYWQRLYESWEQEHAKWKQLNEAYWIGEEAWNRMQDFTGGSLFYPLEPPPEPKFYLREPDEPNAHADVVPDLTHMQIRLAWSEYFNGHWSSKQISSLVLTASETRPERYVFQATPLFDGTLHVSFFCRHYHWKWMASAGSAGGLQKIGSTSAEENVDCGNWVLSGSGGKLKASSTVGGLLPNQHGDLWIVQPDDTIPMFNTFEKKKTVPLRPGLVFDITEDLPANVRLLPKEVIDARREPLPVLKQTPSIYRVTIPHQYTQFLMQGPCFYQDFDRTYIVSRMARSLPPVLERIPTRYRAFVAKLQSQSAKFDLSSRTAPKQGEDVESGRPNRHNRILSKAFEKALLPAPSLWNQIESKKEFAPVTNFNIADAGIDAIGRRAWTSVERMGLISPLLPVNVVLFRNLFHPFVSQFILRLGRGGIDELLSIKTQSIDNDSSENRFAKVYQPTAHVAQPFPKEAVDFGDGAYGVYNRELFCHAPLLMADMWEEAGTMEQAERCLRYLLDPTAGFASTTPGSNTDVFWQYLPFRGLKPSSIENLLLAAGYTGTDPAILATKMDIVAQISAWEKDPFNPYLIGRMRTGAMQKHVVIRWLQHLILHADMLLRSERPEPINEAVQLLVLASNMAGPRAERVPQRTKRKPESYRTLRAKLDRFSNALVLLENDFPIGGMLPVPAPSAGGGLLGMSEALYFCIPPDDLLETLKDTIADRLFKIRHCMNLQGVVRQLPLYEPPIDPALLVAARAQGVDLASVLSDLNAPRPHYRFEVYLEQANQLVEDVRRLGKDLQGVLEARDAEMMTMLRAEQELSIMRQQMRQVKLTRVEEAKARSRVLEEAEKLLSNIRIPFFMRQLGLTEVPPAGSSVQEAVLLSAPEQARIAALNKSHTDLVDASGYAMQAKMMSAFPNLIIGTSGSMASPVAEVHFGGQMIALGLEAFSKMKEQSAADNSHQATLAQIRSEVERRAQQWALELSSAVQEREHIDRQILEARIGLEFAEFDLLAHDRETEFSADRLEFLKTKHTGRSHHDWLKQEITLLLGQYYQLAFDECKRLQQIYRFDTCDPAASFVEFGYFDKAHNGLLAGERLGLALRKMARAHRENDEQEYSLSKPVSLALFDPTALVTLKSAGVCEFTLTEALFDHDFPGHFMRRIRRVTVTIPCITGPYTTVNATLTLLNSRIRNVATTSPAYAERPEDPRFVYQQGIMRSVATSSGNEDSGTTAEANERRSGPFEGYGTISRWRLELPHDTNSFDPVTITDVILRVDYKAREGGELMRVAARQFSILPRIEAAARLFSLRHEFGNAWHRGLRPSDSATEQIFSIDLERDHFPYDVRSRGPKVTGAALILQIDHFESYRSSAPLQCEVVLTSLVNGVPSGTGQREIAILKSIPSQFGGLPVARIKVEGTLPVRIELIFSSADVSFVNPLFSTETGVGPALRHRLNDRTIRDLDVLLTYETEI